MEYTYTAQSEIIFLRITLNIHGSEKFQIQFADLDDTYILRCL
jgi:hypothetical protein